MIATLLSHGWKKLSRSGSFDKEIITSIFLGLFTIILTCCVLILGFALESIISKINNEHCQNGHNILSITLR